MALNSIDLAEELARGNTRENRDRLTRWVGRDERHLAELMQLYLHGAWREAQLAAGVVTLVADAHPDMMDRWLPDMVGRMQDLSVHNAVVRTGMHVLQVLEVPRRLAGRVAQICFTSLEDISQPIAIRVFAMTVLVNLCVGKKRDKKFHRGKEKVHGGTNGSGLVEPELAREVELAIETVLPYGTAAFASRARRELRRLRPDGSMARRSMMGPAEHFGPQDMSYTQESIMANPKQDLFTAGKIAEKLNLSASTVKKAIEDLRLKPAAVKGACKYYGKDAVAKVAAVLK